MSNLKFNQFLPTNCKVSVRSTDLDPDNNYYSLVSDCDFFVSFDRFNAFFSKKVLFSMILSSEYA